METKIAITYKASDSEITFHGVTAAKQSDNAWIYTQTGPWGNTKKTVEERYREVVDKVNELKEVHKLTAVHLLLCNAAYATALYAHGVITEAMLHTMEEKVGTDMNPFIGIPEQDVTIGGQTITIKIVIVDCFSYKSFVFIDDTNKDL